jgi:uncharacterized repeat protein (TIGR02543 family)
MIVKRGKTLITCLAMVLTMGSIYVSPTYATTTTTKTTTATYGKMTFDIEDKNIDYDDLSKYETTRNGDYIVPVNILFANRSNINVSALTLYYNTDLEVLALGETGYADLIDGPAFATDMWDGTTTSKKLVYLDAYCKKETDGVAVTVQLIVPKDEAVVGAKFPIAFSGAEIYGYENDDCDDMIDNDEYVDFLDGYIYIDGEGAEDYENLLIMLDPNGGVCSQECVGGIAYPSSTTIETVPVPTRDGYIFNGWYNAQTGGKKIYDADGNWVTWGGSYPDTLYAHWTEVVVTTVAEDPTNLVLQLDPNGGECSKKYVGGVAYSYGTSISTVPVPTRDGYTFDGWYDSLEGGVLIYDTEGNWVTWNGDFPETLYAHWTKEDPYKDYNFDVNKDGVVNVLDVIFVKKRVLGII